MMDDLGQPQPVRPDVDVIIPTFNRERYLEECIRSIREQTVQPRAVIVVDDGSTDGSVALLHRLAAKWDRLVVIRTPNRGVSAARNTALDHSTADLVAFIDSDDAWLPQKLERQLALFTPGRPELGLVYSGFRRVGPDGAVLPLREIVPDKRGRVFDAMFHRFQGIAPSTMVIRRDLIERVGRFDVSLAQAEDRALCLKLARLCEFDVVSEPLVHFRIHEDSAYESAMKSKRDFVLFQRLQVWNEWNDEAGDAVLARFRLEAMNAAPFRDFFRPRSGLYARLKHSKLALARRLFPSPWVYLKLRSAPVALVRLWWSGALRRARYDLAKDCFARRVVARSPALLRLAHRFGRLRNMSAIDRETSR